MKAVVYYDNNDSVIYSVRPNSFLLIISKVDDDVSLAYTHIESLITILLKTVEKGRVHR